MTQKHPVNSREAKALSQDLGESNRALWQTYSDNSARHIIALSRHMQLKLMASLTVDSGFDGLRLNYEPFVAALARRESGSKIQTVIRPSQLAAQLGISKQIANQILNQLEQYHYIRRIADPNDGRAKLIKLTSKGQRLARDGQAALAKVEAQYREIASRFPDTAIESSARLEQFAVSLANIAAGLNLLPSNIDFSRLQSAQVLGSVLPPLSQYVSHRLMTLTIEKKHPDITMAHGQVITQIGLGGGRIQQMALTHNVSKQAISVIATDLERLGYIAKVSTDRLPSRSTSQEDTRSSLLVFTTKGWRLIADSIESVRQLELEFLALLSANKRQAKQALAEFKSFLSALYHALRLEEEVFDRPLIQVLGAQDGATESKLDLALLAKQLKAHLGEENTRRLALLLDG